MFHLIIAAASAVGAVDDRGIFERAGLCLVRVTTVEVKSDGSFGTTQLRVDQVLIGPARLKGATAEYYVFPPVQEVAVTGGHLYSGRYPDFVYACPKGSWRYWWATGTGKGGWKTADYRVVRNYVDTEQNELLFRFDLKAGSEEATQQADLVNALVRLNARRTRAERLALLKEMQGAKNPHVAAVAKTTLATLTAPPKK